MPRIIENVSLPSIPDASFWQSQWKSLLMYLHDHPNVTRLLVALCICNALPIAGYICFCSISAICLFGFAAVVFGVSMCIGFVCVLPFLCVSTSCALMVWTAAVSGVFISQKLNEGLVRAAAKKSANEKEKSTGKAVDSD